MKKKYKISLKVYKKDIVLQAMEDVSGDVRIEFLNSELIIYGDGEDRIENIFQEFMNYVLYISE